MLQRYWMLETAALVLVMGVALWRGRPSEMWTAVIWSAGCMISPIVEDMHAHHGANAPILIVDLVTAIGLTFIAIRYAHWWTIGVAGAALFEVMIHFAMIAKIGIPIHAYYLSMTLTSDLVVFGVAIGLVAGFLQKAHGLRQPTDRRSQSMF